MVKNTSTLKTLSGLADVVGRVGGALVGISAVAYFVGYKIQNNYLIEAGARWAISLYSFSELVREGQWVILITGITLFATVIHLLDKSTKAERISRWDKNLGWLSLVLLGVAYATSQFWDNYRLDYTISIVAGVLMATSAGLTIGELVGRLDETKRRWGPYHLQLLVFFYMSAFVVAPYLIGHNKAKLELSPAYSTLPVVHFEGEANAKWRLLTTIGDRYFLVKLSEDPAAREFKLSPISADLSVVSTAIQQTNQTTNKLPNPSLKADGPDGPRP